MIITESGKKSPIFVISLERSGSTLLRNLLDTHPTIFAPAQLNIGHLCHWTYFTSYYSIAQVCADLQESERKEAAIEETRNAVNRLMSGFTSKKDKSVWCDKSTTPKLSNDDDEQETEYTENKAVVHLYVVGDKANIIVAKKFETNTVLQPVIASSGGMTVLAFGEGDGYIKSLSLASEGKNNHYD